MHDLDIHVTDCHVHVVGSPPHYTMMSLRPYTPEPASAEQLDTMLDRAGIARVIVVQLSAYGLDNSCMLDAMAKLRHSFRGVVHMAPDSSPTELDIMHAKGVRGIRINLHSLGVSDPAEASAQVQKTAEQCARNGWHIQLFTSPDILADMTKVIVDCPVPVVLDHFGLMSVRQRDSKGEMTIRKLLSVGHLWIKLSGTYRLDDPKAGALARDLYSDNPEQLIWGSDWPHTPEHDGILKGNPGSLPYRDIDPVDLLTSFRGWFDDAAATRILEKNPETLYDF